MGVNYSKNSVNEYCIELNDLIFTITEWGNMDGVDIRVNGKHNAMMLSGSLRFEELRTLQALINLMDSNV